MQSPKVGTFFNFGSRNICSWQVLELRCDDEWNFGSKPRNNDAAVAASALCRPNTDRALSLYAVAADRAALPASPELLRVRRRGRLALRPLGRVVDGDGAYPALSSLGHARARFRPCHPARPRALVHALVLRPLARDQRDAAGPLIGPGCAHGSGWYTRSAIRLPALVRRSEPQRSHRWST